MLPSVLHPVILVFLCKAYFCRRYFSEIHKPKIRDFTHFEKIMWSPNDVVSSCCIPVATGSLTLKFQTKHEVCCQLSHMFHLCSKFSQRLSLEMLTSVLYVAILLSCNAEVPPDCCLAFTLCVLCYIVSNISNCLNM